MDGVIESVDRVANLTGGVITIGAATRIVQVKLGAAQPVQQHLNQKLGKP